MKERFFALPRQSRINYTSTHKFAMPEGTVVVKNFLLPMDERDPVGSARRIETRILLRQDGAWHGYSWAWNDDETDARLVGTEGRTREFTVKDIHGRTSTTTWNYPSRTDCFRCHTSVSGGLLGLTPEAVNTEFKYPESGITANQLATYDSIGLFTNGLPDEPDALPRMAKFHDSEETFENRARAYLAMNCAMCHQPGGPTAARQDFRWTTPNDAMHAIGQSGYFRIPGVPDTKIIAPGSPEKSSVHYRMSHRDAATQMPPLATAKVDEEALAVIEQWIRDLAE